MLVFALALAFSSCGIAQVQTDSGLPKSKAVLSKLSPPTYPTLARQARISGTVEVEVRVRQDGTVESVQVISGHPMLIYAALESARHSLFECTECDQVISPYTLDYQFTITSRDPPRTCDEPEQAPPPAELDTIKHEVTVSAWPVWTCDPSSELKLIRVRSAKCLYLWKCSVRYPM
jgi:TonB family protein